MKEKIRGCFKGCLKGCFIVFFVIPVIVYFLNYVFNSIYFAYRFGSLKYVRIPSECNNEYFSGISMDNKIFFEGETSCIYDTDKNKFSKIKTSYLLNHSLQFYMKDDWFYEKEGRLYNYKTGEIKSLPVNIKLTSKERKNKDKIYEHEINSSKIFRAKEENKDKEFEICDIDTMTCTKGKTNFEEYPYSPNKLNDNEMFISSFRGKEIYKIKENQLIVSKDQYPKYHPEKLKDNYFYEFVLAEDKDGKYLYNNPELRFIVSRTYVNDFVLYEYKNNRFNFVKKYRPMAIKGSVIYSYNIGDNKIFISGVEYGEAGFLNFNPKEVFIFDYEKEKTYKGKLNFSYHEAFELTNGKICFKNGKAIVIFTARRHKN